MICCWNFYKHNILQIRLLTHCVWFRKSAMEDAGGSAHGCVASLHRLEHRGGHYSCHFVTKCQNILPVWRHPSAMWTVPWMKSSSLHTLDCLQWRDLWMFPFQHLTSVDVQVSQELTVWCINLEILNKLRPSVGTYNICIRHALLSENRQFCIYGCILDLTFAQKLSKSAHVLEDHSVWFFTTILWMSQLATKQKKTRILMSYACLNVHCS